MGTSAVITAPLFKVSTCVSYWVYICGERHSVRTHVRVRKTHAYVAEEKCYLAVHPHEPRASTTNTSSSSLKILRVIFCQIFTSALLIFTNFVNSTRRVVRLRVPGSGFCHARSAKRERPGILLAERINYISYFLVCVFEMTWF